MEKRSMPPIYLEVIAPMLSSVEMSCRRCGFVFDSLGLKSKYRNRCAEEYPEDWKAAVGYLSDWIGEISSLYRHRIRIRIIDALTPLGLWKQLRYRVFRFPAFVVDQKQTYIGWDHEELEALIDTRIQGTMPQKKRLTP
jgi:hypothetical protein